MSLDLTEYLMNLLNQSGNSFSTTSERELVRVIKERLGYVLIDPMAENPHKMEQFELPDGQGSLLINKKIN